TEAWGRLPSAPSAPLEIRLPDHPSSYEDLWVDLASSCSSSLGQPLVRNGFYYSGQPDHAELHARLQRLGVQGNELAHNSRSDKDKGGRRRNQTVGQLAPPEAPWSGIL